MPAAMALPGQNFSQRTGRVWRSFTDQHGREFESWADGPTSQPIGELMPKGFSPPWLPPMRFAKFAKEGDLTFNWDYSTIAEELATTSAGYYDDAIKVAIQDHLPVPEIGGPVDRRIRAVIGAPPLSPAIPLSAEKGDAWILGFPGSDKNDELASILGQGVGTNSHETLTLIRERVASQIGDKGIVNVADRKAVEPGEVTYKEFMGEARKRGMSMADIALAWQAHKENLAVAA
jgi:hypothetical protein